VQHMWTEFEAQVFDGFDADEREMLRQAFERIQENLLRLDEENVEV
jgi:ppGpp synthetase/RelA/SpoT-type nucleotidyltranferase